MLFVFGTLDDQGVPAHLELRLFSGHDDTQELVVQPLRGNHKVKKGDVHGQLGQVVGVPELSGDVESKTGRIFDDRISQFDAENSALVVSLLQKYRLHDGIHLFAYVFQEERISKANGIFQSVVEVRGGELDYFKSIRLLEVPDEFVGLTLGVDHEGPPAGPTENKCKYSSQP